MKDVIKHIDAMNQCLKDKIDHQRAIIKLSENLTEDVHDGLNHEIVSTVVLREQHIFELDQHFLSERKKALEKLGIKSLEMLEAHQKKALTPLKETQELISQVQALSQAYLNAKRLCEKFSIKMRALHNEVKTAHKVKLAYEKSKKNL